MDAEKGRGKMKKCFKLLSLVIGIAAYGLLFLVFYLQSTLPNQLYVTSGQEIRLAGGQIEVEEVMGCTTVEKSGTLGEAKLMGFLRIKSIALKEVERPWLVPCGEPFGIKMLTQGAMVIGLGSVQGNNGNQSPAKNAGVQVGDIILSYNDIVISSSSQLNRLTSENGGTPAKLLIQRGEKQLTLSLTPALNTQGEYQMGLWVRDSSAGIGTLTYYNPIDQSFGGLGHGVCDVDTGELMPFQSGEVVEVFITGAKKGVNGIPGELYGEFHTSVQTGVLTDNRTSGVYGTLYSKPSQEQAIPMAFRQEVHTGPAEILVTLEGIEPHRYAITIEKVNQKEFLHHRDMILKITDPKLLEKTGGIVQGMSGSPILQDGKLVGAVTHVFVNDPTRGYGIFSETMLKESGFAIKQQDNAAA